MPCAFASNRATFRQRWPPAASARHSPSLMRRCPIWWRGDFHRLIRRLETSTSLPSIGGAMLDTRTYSAARPRCRHEMRLRLRRRGSQSCEGAGHNARRGAAVTRVKVRHYVVKRAQAFWQPTKKMRALGFYSVSLVKTAPMPGRAPNNGTIAGTRRGAARHPPRPWSQRTISPQSDPRS